MSYQDKHNGRRRNCAAERWARAFGVSTERLAALIKEVSEQRQAPGNGRRPSRKDHPHRPAGGGLD
jgi:hypothetical protein